MTVCKSWAGKLNLEVLLTTRDREVRRYIHAQQQWIKTATEKDREDLVQEVLTKMWECYRRQTKSFPNWLGLLRVVSHNAACDFVRRQRRARRVASNSTIIEQCSVEMVDSPGTARDEMMEELRALQQKGCPITDQEIAIVVARLCDGATYKEIARTVGCKARQAREKFFKALDKLRPYKKPTQF